MQIAISLLIGIAIGCVLGGMIVANLSIKKYDYATINASKNLMLFQMTNQWVRVKQRGKNIAEYLKKNGINRIAIYGISYAGNTLISELENQDIEIVYGIDKRKDKLYSNFELRFPEEVTDDIDAVIVTAIFYYDTIKTSLNAKLSCPIISLDSIIEQL